MPEAPLNYKDYIDNKLKEQDNLSPDFFSNLSGSIAYNARALWILLGKMESEFNEDKLKAIKITSPVYVTGLARSGTTILLESLYKSGRFGSCTYRQYPFIYFPLIWQKIAKMTKQAGKSERAHFDRIDIDLDSPEALEEMIWRYFFGAPLNISEDYPLTENTTKKDFKEFYQNFIRKILYLNGKERYLAKGNYNIARIPYLLKINPDAKFVLCIRKPEDHISSLRKQHYLFSKLEHQNKRALNYMNWIGHNEFGLNRAPTYLGRPEAFKKITEAWTSGNEIEGWARQWSYIYDYVADTLLGDPEIAPHIHFMKYEDLCDQPAQQLQGLFQFCRIEDSDELIKEQAQVISAPSYYQNDFSEEEQEIVHKFTAKTVSKFYN